MISNYTKIGEELFAYIRENLSGDEEKIKVEVLKLVLTKFVDSYKNINSLIIDDPQTPSDEIVTKLSTAYRQDVAALIGDSNGIIELDGQVIKDLIFLLQPYSLNSFMFVSDFALIDYKNFLQIDNEENKPSDNLFSFVMNIAKKHDSRSILSIDDNSLGLYRVFTAMQYSAAFTSWDANKNSLLRGTLDILSHSVSNQKFDFVFWALTNVNQMSHEEFETQMIKIEEVLNHEGIIVVLAPRQILAGWQQKDKEIKQSLVNYWNIHTIIDLPGDTFGNSTKLFTSLLVLSKNEKKNVFGAICQNIGEKLVLNMAKKIIGDDESDLHKIYLNYSDYVNRKSISSSLWGFEFETDELNQEKLIATAYSPDLQKTREQLISLNQKNIKVETLEELVLDIFVPRRHTRKYVNSTSPNAVPFLSGAELESGVSEKCQPLEYMRKTKMIVEKGWLLVSRSGTIGKVYLVNDLLRNKAVSEHFIRIVPDTTKVNPSYLFAYLSSDHGQKLIKGQVTSSKMDIISENDLKEMLIPIPDKAREQKIADLINDSERLKMTSLQLQQDAINNVDKILEATSDETQEMVKLMDEFFS